jgi:hypothetical protein
MAAGKNAVINGGMDIWQRGTSMAGNATAFCADRWQGYRGVAGSTFSRQATSDTTNLPFIQYCTRMSRDSGNTATNNLALITNFETVNSIPYAGKTITFSFYARSGANFSATSSLLNVEFLRGTGTDQNLITGFTGQTNMTPTPATLTTTWQRFSYTVTPTATTTQLGISLYWTPVGTAGAADYCEVTGLQVEVGSVATQFSRAGGTIQGELAACQRYYWRNTPTSNYGQYGVGVIGDANNAVVNVALPVTMRSGGPTSIDIPSTVSLLQLTNFYTASYTPTGISILDSSPNVLTLRIQSSGMTVGQAILLRNNNGATSSYFLGAGNEL